MWTKTADQAKSPDLLNPAEYINAPAALGTPIPFLTAKMICVRLRTYVTISLPLLILLSAHLFLQLLTDIKLLIQYASFPVQAYPAS